MNNLFIQVHGKANSLPSDGATSNIEGFLTFIENLLTNGSGAMNFSFLPGLIHIPNIHPLLVHFPIALLSLFFLLDCIGSLFNLSTWRRTASWFLYIGAISAILTVIAGLQAAASIPHNEIVHKILQQHQTYGITVAALSIFLSAWRIIAKPSHFFVNFLYQTISLVLVIAMTLGADLGGLMVYKHAVATAAFNKTNTGHNHHSHSH